MCTHFLDLLIETFFFLIAFIKNEAEKEENISIFALMHLSVHLGRAWIPVKSGLLIKRVSC